jgi:hypothetical protein
MASLRWLSARRCLAACWECDCCAWRPTSLSSRRPRLVFHCQPVPSCRHEFRDHGRDRRSHRCGSAVGACVSNPRRDSSPHHGKRKTRIIAFRASSSAPACGDRVRVHLSRPEVLVALGAGLAGGGRAELEELAISSWPSGWSAWSPDRTGVQAAVVSHQAVREALTAYPTAGLRPSVSTSATVERLLCSTQSLVDPACAFGCGQPATWFQARRIRTLARSPRSARRRRTCGRPRAPAT